MALYLSMALLFLIFRFFYGRHSVGYLLASIYGIFSRFTVCGFIVSLANCSDIGLTTSGSK